VRANDRSYQLRLCRYPDCEVCLNSPESFVFHFDCFNLLRSTKSTDICRQLSQIWQLSSWSRPWVKAPFLEGANPVEVISFEPLYRVMGLDMANLPLEIQQIIVKQSYNAPIWRYVSAWECQGRLEKLEGDIVTQPITNARYWNRSMELIGPHAPPKGNIVSIGFDCFGLKLIDFSNTWPSSTSRRSASCDWYIVEEKCSLLNLELESKV